MELISAKDRAEQLGFKQIPKNLKQYRPLGYYEYHGEPIRFQNGSYAVPYQWDEHGVWIIHHDSTTSLINWQFLLAYESQSWDGKGWRIMGVLTGEDVKTNKDFI